PLTGALLASVGGAAGVEWLRGRRKAAGDQALALLFYTGIAAGVVLVSAAGELNANLFAYLFGSILTVTRSDVVVVVCLGIAGLIVVGVLYRSLVAAALDEDAARVSGVPVAQLNVFLAALAGVTIAVSMRIVGILLIAALTSGLQSSLSLQVSGPLYGSTSFSSRSSPRRSPTRMYAKVLNASKRCGVSTSPPISAWSFWIWATIVPIGSSTSGIQTSSG